MVVWVFYNFYLYIWLYSMKFLPTSGLEICFFLLFLSLGSLRSVKFSNGLIKFILCQY